MKESKEEAVIREFPVCPQCGCDARYCSDRRITELEARDARWQAVMKEYSKLVSSTELLRMKARASRSNLSGKEYDLMLDGDEKIMACYRAMCIGSLEGLEKPLGIEVK